MAPGSKPTIQSFCPGKIEFWSYIILLKEV